MGLFDIFGRKGAKAKAKEPLAELNKTDMNSAPFDPFNTPPSRPTDNSFSGSMQPQEASSFMPDFNTQSYAPQQDNTQTYAQNDSPDLVMIGKNIEIMMSKLDAIRTAVENLSHRMDALESSMNKKNQW